MRTVLILIGSNLFLLGLGKTLAQKNTKLIPKTIGLWQVPTKAYIGSNVFKYDGKYITMLLITEKEWMWHSADDFYKLKSKWENDELFYLPPFGDWEPLAKFDGSNFYIKDNFDAIWKYTKVTKEVLSTDDLPILLSRKVHNYKIKPIN